MLKKYGKEKVKPEEEFPFGYETKIEMPTDTLGEYLTTGNTGMFSDSAILRFTL